MRSGYVYPGYHYLYGAGDEGDYWSASAYSSNLAYAFYFYSSDVLPSNYDYRYLGFSVRCVAGWE